MWHISETWKVLKFPSIEWIQRFFFTILPLSGGQEILQFYYLDFKWGGGTNDVWRFNALIS